MIQELCVPSAGFISCLAWVLLSDSEEDVFVFGASDGNIHLYEWSKGHPLFTFCSITVVHKGAIESLAWDSIHCCLASVGNSEARLWNVSPKASKLFCKCSYWLLVHLSWLLSESFVSLTPNAAKQPYVARAVHFCNNGSSLLVCYLESGFVYATSIPLVYWPHLPVDFASQLIHRNSDGRKKWMGTCMWSFNFPTLA